MAKTRAKNKQGVLGRVSRRIGGTGSLPVRVLRWLLFLMVAGFIAGALVFAVLYATIKIPDPNADFQTETTNVYYSDGKTKIGSFATQNRERLEYDEIPEVMRDAVVAAEDRTFWENRGIDLRGIVRAARNNATSGSITGGGSTITQQYVKILYLNQERSYTRKVKEAILSVKIHNQLTKQEILEGYLNTIYYGNGSYGVEVASRTYFGKPAAKLNIGQAAFLATVINNPSYFDPYAEGARERVLPRFNYVLDGMVKRGSITAEQAAAHRGKFPKFKKQRANQRFEGPKGHLLELTRKQLRAEGFLDSEIEGGGLRVVTTFDKNMQKDAVEAVKQVRPDGLDELNTAVVSVQPGTGAVRAMYGGPDYLKSQLNWATLGTQPGSTFKAFAVVAALENGYSLQTRLNGNAPLKIGNDEIQNQGDSGGKSYGFINLETATQFSVNTAFVDLTDQMEDGPEKILKAAREAGIPESTVNQIQPVLGVSLGYEKVAPIDMANAYATLAADGKRAEWYVIDRVDDSRGARVFKHNVATTQTIDEDVAADTLAALQAVVRAGSGTKARTFCPTVGKTGTATANDGKDGEDRVSSSWFVGATPKLATAVMYNRGKGNEELEGYLNPFFGGTYPATTFGTYMNRALEGTECGTFPKRANIKADKGTAVYTNPGNGGDKKKKTPKPEKKETKPTPKPTRPAPEPTTPAPTAPAPEPEPTATPPVTPPPATTSPGAAGGGSGNGDGSGSAPGPE
ncbi:penicillin-binding protein [Aeromicrobium senzhongii]|uniref:Penicillin-binding protein n=1 Tax=Aeromicrobium senzhongii TaxID=2663859 RepID=A0ABX6SSL9_9ACTN|nr:transglycosylase domain-containing protein [Aeromicrobium senzhongii]MTB89469.1 penicillin-binding protein [Aeromicrobium senzhongii]QNL94394.1 penicillin-binding protein [Aeromicrobium senzhongii]